MLGWMCTCRLKPLGESGSRTAKPCGPGTRCWCQVGGSDVGPTGLDQPYSSTTVTRRIRRRGEQGISRKTIAQGNAGCSGVPVVTTVCIFCCTRAAGAPRTRHSPRPLLRGARAPLLRSPRLIPSGAQDDAKLGRVAPRHRGCMPERLFENRIRKGVAPIRLIGTFRS
jgi:hypothetical protein